MEKAPKNLLFICTGNTCRSVMAELLLNKLSAERGLGLSVKSCGIAAESYFAVPQGVRNALKADGLEIIAHKARLVSRELLAWADLALAMARLHREVVVDLYPEVGPKIHVLREYVGLPQPDIDDPIGWPDPIYAACRDKIRETLEALIQKHELTQNPRP
jgi:protein-tyrosine-phosphatase